MKDYPHIIPSCLPQRIWMALLCFFGLTISYILRFSLSMAINVMVQRHAGKTDPNACKELIPHTTEAPERSAKIYDWDEHLQGLILSSFFWGYVCTQIPGGIIADRYGPWYVVTFGIFMSSFFTALTPIVTILFDYIGLIIVRVFVGLAQGVVYASLHTIVALWIPPHERGRWGTLVFSGSHFGNFLSTLSGGWILNHLPEGEWELIFYVYATFGFLWVIIFVFTTYPTPIEHPKLTEEELEMLSSYMEHVGKSEVVSHTPYKAILTSKPVWAIIFAMIGHDWGLFALVIDLPKFLHSVLHFEIKKNGSYMATGFFLVWSCAILSGLLVDYMQKKEMISRTHSRKLFTTIGSLGPSFGMILCSYAGCNVTLAITFLIVGMTFMGTFYPSLKVNPIDLAPNHAGFLGALGHGMGGFSGIIVPYLVGFLTPNNFLMEWRIVFWISFAVMSATNITYVILASGELQPWNDAGYMEDRRLSRTTSAMYRNK